MLYEHLIEVILKRTKKEEIEKPENSIIIF